MDARGLKLVLGSREALDGVDLHLHGGVVTVLGPNGSGKTTLLRCLATVLAPDDGTLHIDGLDVRAEADRVEIRRRLGYLPQEPGFASRARVFDVVDYLAVLKGLDDDRSRRRSVFEALDLVGLADRASERIGELSGGMRRRLGLAQALLGSPRLLVLDEPSAALDPDERLRLREVIGDLRHRATIVVSSHLTDEAALGDVVVVLVDGATRFVGTPADLADRAKGRAWLQDDPPPRELVRASWRQADGRYRCLGHPPADVATVAATMEDGWLLVTSTADRS